MIQKSSKIGSVLLGVLLGTAAVAASAEGTEYSVKGGLINPQGDLRKLTQSSTGYGAELGYDILPTKDEAVGFGLNIGFLSAKGKVKPFETYTAKASYGGADLIYAVGQTPLTIRAGLQMISWDVTSLKPAIGTGAQGETSWKFGARVGAEYRFGKQWSATAMYSFSQWKSDVETNVAVNPSFLSVMVGYKF